MVIKIEVYRYIYRYIIFIIFIFMSTVGYTKDFCAGIDGNMVT